MAKMNFQVTKKAMLSDGFYKMQRFDIKHDRYDGKTQSITRELMNRHDAVCVMCFDPWLQQVVLIEQFRVGAIELDNAWLIELVAGLIDKDEEPEEVAKREAVEEAGLEILALEPVFTYQPSPGGSNEVVHLYIGCVDASSAGGIFGLPEEGEDIKVLVEPLPSFFDWMKQGKTNNAATLLAGQYLQLNAADLSAKWLKELALHK